MGSHEDWFVVQVQATIRRVLEQGPATAAAIAYTEKDLTVEAVREQLAVMAELDQVTCLTSHEPSEWMLT